MLYDQTRGVLNLLGAGTVLEFDAGCCNTVVVTGVRYCLECILCYYERSNYIIHNCMTLN